MVEDPGLQRGGLARVVGQAVENAPEGVLRHLLGGVMIGHERVDEEVQLVEAAVEDLGQGLAVEDADAVYESW